MTLSVKDLCVARGGVRLLDAVSFDVAPGAALILRGPNGSGKTTLLRTLAGLQSAITGRVDPGPDQLAYGAHADAIKAALTVSENLRFWARVFGAQSIDAAVAAFRLGTLLDRPGGELSSGQKRRLGLARLMLTGRPIWCLDEPTVSLDAQAVAWFGDVVRGHLSAGGSAVIATHIDLGLDAPELDVSAFKARAPLTDEGF
ncbi:MAG: heme ABC exporter ATP-binding protein CcmA [Pseudomonadota bacterium]